MFTLRVPDQAKDIFSDLSQALSEKHYLKNGFTFFGFQGRLSC